MSSAPNPYEAPRSSNDSPHEEPRSISEKILRDLVDSVYRVDVIKATKPHHPRADTHPHLLGINAIIHRDEQRFCIQWVYSETGESPVPTHQQVCHLDKLIKWSDITLWEKNTDEKGGYSFTTKGGETYRITQDREVTEIPLQNSLGMMIDRTCRAIRNGVDTVLNALGVGSEKKDSK